MSNMDQDESEQMQNHSPESLNVIPTGAVDPRKDIEKEYKDQWYVLEQFKSSVRQDNGLTTESTASQENNSHTENSGTPEVGKYSRTGSALTTSCLKETDSTITNGNDANFPLTNDQGEHEQWFALMETGSSGSSRCGSQRSSPTLPDSGPLTTIETAVLSQTIHRDSGNESSSSVKSEAKHDPAQQFNQTDSNGYNEQWYVLQQLKASIKDMPLNESSLASEIGRQIDRSSDLTLKDDTKDDPTPQLGNSSTGDVSEANDQTVNTRQVSVVTPNQWVTPLIKEVSGSDANIGSGAQLTGLQANRSLTRDDKSLSSESNHSLTRLDSLGGSSDNFSCGNNSNTVCKSNNSSTVSLSEQHTNIPPVVQRTSPSSASDVSVEFVRLPNPSLSPNQLPYENSREVHSTNGYNSHTPLPSSLIQSPIEQNGLNSYSPESIKREAEYSQQSDGDFWVEPARVSDHIGPSSLLPSRPLTIGRNGSSEATQQRAVSGASSQVTGQTSAVPIYYPVPQETSLDTVPSTDNITVYSPSRPGGSLNGTMLPTERLQPDGRDGVEINAAPWTKVTTSTVQSITSSASVSPLLDLSNSQTSSVSSLVSHSISTGSMLSSGYRKSSETPQSFVNDSNCANVDSGSESNERDELVGLLHQKQNSSNQEENLINHFPSPKRPSSVESNMSSSIDAGLDNKDHSPKCQSDFHYVPREEGTQYLQGRPKTQLSLFQDRERRPFGMVSEDEESSPVTKLLGPSFKAAQEMLERLKQEKLRSYSDSGSDSSKQDDLSVSPPGSLNREDLNSNLDGSSTFRDTSLLRVKQSDDKLLSSDSADTSYVSNKLVKRQYESSKSIDSDVPYRGPGFAWSMPIPSSDFQRTTPIQTTSIFSNEKPSTNGSFTSVKQDFSEISVEDTRQKKKDKILAEIEARYPVGSLSTQSTRFPHNGVDYHHKLAWQGSSNLETSILGSENVKVPSRLSTIQVEETHTAADFVTVEEDKHPTINTHHSQIQLSSPSYDSAVEISSDDTDDLLSYEPVLEGNFHYLKKNRPGTDKVSGKLSTIAKTPRTISDRGLRNSSGKPPSFAKTVSTISDSVLRTSSGKPSSFAKTASTISDNVLRTSSGKPSSFAKTASTINDNVLRTSSGKPSSFAKTASTISNSGLRTSSGKPSSFAKTASTISDSILRTSSGKPSSFDKISTISDNVLRTSPSGRGYVPKQEVKPQRSPSRISHSSIDHGFSASSIPADVREADVSSRNLPYRSWERREFDQPSSSTNITAGLEQREDKAMRDYHLSLGAGTVTPITDFSPIDYGSYLRPVSAQVGRSKYEDSNLTDGPSIEEQSICSLSEDVLSVQDDEEIMQRNAAPSLHDIELQSESSTSDMYRPFLKEEALSSGKRKENTSYGIYDIRKSSGPGSTNRRRRAMGLKAIPPRAKLQDSRDLSVYVSGGSTQSSQYDSQRTNLPETNLHQTHTSEETLLREKTAAPKDSPSFSESSQIVEDHIYVTDDVKENIARVSRPFDDLKTSNEGKSAEIQKKNGDYLNTVKNKKSKSKTHHHGKLVQQQQSDVPGKPRPQKKLTRSRSQALRDSQDLNELWGRFQRSLRDESPDSEGSNSTLSRLSKLSSMLSQPLPRRVSSPSSQHSSLTSVSQTERYTGKKSGRSFNTSSLSDSETTLSLDDAFVEPAIKTSVTRQLKLRQLLKNVRPDKILNGPVLEHCKDDSTTETTTTGISSTYLKTVSEDSSDTLTSLEPQDTFPHSRPRTVPRETHRLRFKKDGTKCPCVCGAAKGRNSVSQDKHQDLVIQTIDSGMHDIGVNFPTPRTSPRDKGRQGKRERGKVVKRMSDAATQTRGESILLPSEHLSSSENSTLHEREEKQPKTPTKSKQSQLQEERYVITQRSPRDERKKQQIKMRPTQITPRKRDDRPVPCQNSPDLITRKLQERSRGEGKSGPVWFHPVSNKHYSRPSQPLRETRLNQTRVDTFDTTMGAPHSLQKLSLQEAFLYAKPCFVKKSRERLENVAQKRQDFELTKHQKENLASNNQEIDEDDVGKDFPKDDVAQHPKHQDVDKRLRFAYSEHLHQPKRRPMTRKEMLELNKRLYSKLPEVKEMQEKKRRQAFYCSNLQRARLYGKRVRNRLKQHGH